MGNTIRKKQIKLESVERVPESPGYSESVIHNLKLKPKQVGPPSHISKEVKIVIEDPPEEDPKTLKKSGDKSINMQKAKKKLVVPSFSTTSSIFAEHYRILNGLRGRIEMLKQAYFKQQDQGRTWEQVDQILSELEKACEFLDF